MAHSGRRRHLRWCSGGLVARVMGRAASRRIRLAGALERKPLLPFLISSPSCLRRGAELEQWISASHNSALNGTSQFLRNKTEIDGLCK